MFNSRLSCLNAGVVAEMGWLGRLQRWLGNCVSESKTEIARVIAAAIERHPQSDPEALAREIISELHRAGRFIVPGDPTEKMSAAVAKTRDQGHWGLTATWRAMVEAAE